MTDPREAPRIDLNFLSTPRDRQLLADGLRIGWELAQTPEIRDLAERVVLLNDSVMNSEDAVHDYVTATVDPAYNPVGTARMGAAPLWRNEVAPAVPGIREVNRAHPFRSLTVE